jgi:hypothetical protein
MEDSLSNIKDVTVLKGITELATFSNLYGKKINKETKIKELLLINYIYLKKKLLYNLVKRQE